MSYRKNSPNDHLKATWTAFAISSIVGLGLSMAYVSWRSHALLLSWRERQAEIVRSDLMAIETLYPIAQLRHSSSESLPSSAVELIAKSQSAIELLTKGGDLSCSFASESNASDSGKNRGRNEVSSVWSVEPDGFNRLKITRPLNVDAPDGNELSLARRFSTDEATRLEETDWLWTAITGIVPVMSGLWLSRKRRTRKQFLGAISEWSNQVAHSSNIALESNSANGMEEIDPAVNALLQRTAQGVHQRLDSIQRSVEQSTRVMSAMPVGVLAFDQNLKLLFVNRAGKELLSIGDTVQFGQPMIEVIRQPNVVNLIQQVSSESHVQEVELELPLSKLILRLRAHPISAVEPNADLPSTGGVLLTLTDETRLKQLENARRDFTANVSHELKTPLSAIKAYAETLLMGALEDEEASHRFVERIAEQANRLDSLIRDLLHLTRLQSQPEKPQLSDLLLDDVLKTCVEEHRTIGQAKKITIDTSGVEQDCRVEADLESLRTIVGNLLSNAVRYNRENGWIRVSTHRELDRVTLVISDSGIGIPPEDLDRIFERFYRVEKARSQDSGGTGLGLSIVKHLVQAMSAEIHVSSSLGKGSSFELKLKSALPTHL